MRHVVYLLLVANLVYLGWNLFQTRTGNELVRELPLLPPLPPTAKRLVTLQELQQQQQRHVQQQDEVQGKPEAGQEVDDATVAEALMQAEPPGAGVSMLCQSLGPFLVVEQLEEVAGKLGELGLESRRRSSENRLENGWWVYLPAMPRSAAKESVKLLDDNKDREYYVGKGNFIALGTFNELSRAERRLKSARRLGLEPLLETRYKTQISHWLDLRVPGGLDGDLTWITEDYPQLRLEQQSCK